MFGHDCHPRDKYPSNHVVFLQILYIVFLDHEGYVHRNWVRYAGNTLPPSFEWLNHYWTLETLRFEQEQIKFKVLNFEGVVAFYKNKKKKYNEVDNKEKYLLAKSEKANDAIAKVENRLRQEVYGGISQGSRGLARYSAEGQRGT